ncbi:MULTISPECIES: efflux RND transporter periplasmic adaptor subunit [unclassified Microbulbifer]|uniref:efflux RND transporter periplasmic adaptor subunit n=1 Tax=unclassified Microbulbifer TaxID=2619833 RepID=UPI0027E47673|nr:MULTISPECIES: efflux RND transporter periplasmic adaptor subunit [unclassified Microbulbifer]
MSNRVLNKRMLLMLLGSALLFGGIFAFKIFGNYMMNRAFDTMPQPPATVTSTAAEIQIWRESLSAVGTMRAVNGVDVTTEAQGVVRAIHFKSGQTVNKGELLLELSAEPEKAQLQVLQAELRLARRNHQRTSILRERGVTTEAELDQTLSTLEQVQANIEVQRATVNERRVTAPFSGKLGIRLVDLGQNVDPGQAVVSLEQLDPIYVDFFLPERYFSRVAPQQSVKLTSDAYPKRIFQGRITAIAARVDSDSRNFQVQATLRNPEQKLRPGMFAEVSVELPTQRRVVVVPRTALSFAPYGDAVFVLQRSKEGDGLVAQKRVVKTGEERGDLVEIVQGLREGEQVATSGLLKLRNGSPVNIDNANKPPAETNPQPENS